MTRMLTLILLLSKIGKRIRRATPRILLFHVGRYKQRGLHNTNNRGNTHNIERYIRNTQEKQITSGVITISSKTDTYTNIYMKTYPATHICIVIPGLTCMLCIVTTLYCCCVLQTASISCVDILQTMR
jgi:hypothetical protein